MRYIEYIYYMVHGEWGYVADIMFICYIEYVTMHSSMDYVQYVKL